MASTPESKVKAKAVAILKELEAYYFFPATHGYGRSGVPDIVACYYGRFIGIECKAGKNQPTALQIREMNDIMNAGGISILVNEENLMLLSGILKSLRP